MNRQITKWKKQSSRRFKSKKRRNLAEEIHSDNYALKNASKDLLNSYFIDSFSLLYFIVRIFLLLKKMCSRQQKALQSGVFNKGE